MTALPTSEKFERIYKSLLVADVRQQLSAFFPEQHQLPNVCPEGLLATERSRARNATSHAPPSATDHRLLEAIFFVARMTLYYAGVSKSHAKRKGGSPQEQFPTQAIRPKSEEAGSLPEAGKFLAVARRNDSFISS